jgi:hypothetical protein
MRAAAGVSPRRPGLDPRCEMCNKNVAMRQAFLRVPVFFLCQYHSTNVTYAAYLSGYLNNALTKRTNGLSLEKLPKSDALSVNWRTGGREGETHFTFYSSLQLLKGEHISRFQSEPYS